MCINITNGQKSPSEEQPQQMLQISSLKHLNISLISVGSRRIDLKFHFECRSRNANKEYSTNRRTTYKAMNGNNILLVLSQEIVDLPTK